jgi:hypothetical protein
MGGSRNRRQRKRDSEKVDFSAHDQELLAATYNRGGQRRQQNNEGMKNVGGSTGIRV